jgi:hypothetical protein
MSKKKESIFSKIFKPKKSSCCCSMEIVEEPNKIEDRNKKKEQAKNKED